MSNSSLPRFNYKAIGNAGDLASINPQPTRMMAAVAVRRLLGINALQAPAFGQTPQQALFSFSSATACTPQPKM